MNFKDIKRFKCNKKKSKVIFFVTKINMKNLECVIALGFTTFFKVDLSFL